jgi:mannose-6-phosphate isomerase-like protein (cupin superfamily)
VRAGPLAAALLLLAFAVAALGLAEGPEPVLDALVGEERITVPLAALAERETLPPGENFKVVELARDAHTSHHVVWIRDREVPHRHDRHDLMVVMLRGHGFMRIGEEERALGEGSILYVPRATVHAFRNTFFNDTATTEIYTPAFDGRDREIAP